MFVGIGIGILIEELRTGPTTLVAQSIEKRRVF